MGTPNKQIGWSQEASLLQIISKQLEQLAGLLANISGGGGGSAGSLKTLGDVPITSTLTRITDGGGNVSGLYLSTKAITNYAGSPPANLNVAFGENTLTAITTGQYNDAFGAGALAAVTQSSYNIAIGTSAMLSYNDADASGNKGQNVAIGAFAMYAATSGKWNTVIGTSALQNGASSFSTIIGAHAGENAGGSANVFVGYYAGNATTGAGNILIGVGAGGGGVTSGSNNIILSGNDLRNGITTGSRNVIIGGITGVTNGDDQVIIGTGGNVRRMSFDSAGQMTITTAPTTGVGSASEKMLTRDTTTGAVKQIDITASQLEALNEGNGIGWRLLGRNAARYGNIGLNAIDFSESQFNSSTRGATGQNSFAVGQDSIASGGISAAFGSSNAAGGFSIAAGQTSTTNGSSSFAMGNFCTAGGDFSFAQGRTNTAASYGEVVVGSWGELIAAGSAIAWVATDPSFRVANGDHNGVRKDGFRVYKNNAIYMNPTLVAAITNGANGFFFYNDATKKLASHDGTAWRDYAQVGTTAPASATAAGTTGEIRITSTFIYCCIATNTWVRAALASW